ncbi:nitrate reductase molybdenum cofactor assembly chaperone [Nocardia vaccinii]|uniref:nitrate reductase molybdenum cofactor assembly chaperone n=1 Tax=Nocardia vaccinii TaxID=1822 RepID=UPI000B0A8142|nr:nitrate reductase molybdenum cofactor assembly chaperone [Nocardia vaccinii]
MTGDSVPALYQAAAHCLDYPDERFFDRLPLFDAGAPALRPFLKHAAAVGRAALCEQYVQVFDFHNRHCLHLTWWQDGDTRRRGSSLARLKHIYREHGMELRETELPDHLPVVLEFCAATGSSELLLEHRPGLELLRLALDEAETPYVHVLNALSATLPGPTPRDRAAARALARSGPATETVGLSPYGHLDLLPVLGNGGH